MVGGRQTGKGYKPQALEYAGEESDEPIVPKKPANSRVTPEESVEGRGEAKGKPARGDARQTQDWPRALTVPERVGTRARQDKKARFNNLLSHIKAPLLHEAYLRLRPNAAVGVDGQTWEEYGKGIDERLRDLQDRVHRGSYHPQPVRRTYIPKPDGRQRPLGIPALEDKIVQMAAKMLLEPIYEAQFVGFSYGFRPGRSQHNALDALWVALNRKTDWVLDADIRSFFDTIDHGWMQKFLEHRISDRRMVRLLMKWLHAGVLEEGKLLSVERGTPQGGVISPLLANIYLHYAFDLWIQWWRKTHAHGEVMVVRYADDFVICLQREVDARTLREALAERLAKFALELHPDKTRILRFGRFARRDSVKDGRTRPETFEFLGFTHICGAGRENRSRLIRRTSRKKRRAKLQALKEEVDWRKHAPVSEQHTWLCQVLRGHFNYYGVPGNWSALAQFRSRVRHLWYRALQRRSQRARWSASKRDRFDTRFALPPARITHPWPFQRLSVPST
jgi:RNA-directed DNA polymerase